MSHEIDFSVREHTLPSHNDGKVFWVVDEWKGPRGVFPDRATMKPHVRNMLLHPATAKVRTKEKA